MNNIQSPTLIKSITANPWIANGLAVFGGLLYLLHSRYYAITQISVLDEGAYLLKGLLFMDGTYSPFQDNGPLTNHMPLSFLFHGVIQTLFGPGLREGRYFMLLIGLLMLVGVWLLVKRLRGPWLAALAVWLIAINPGTARFYSLAATQSMIACLLIWTLFFSHASPHHKRSLIAITFSGILAGLMALTRLNMIPVLPLLILYIFWAHGKKAGLLALASGLITFLVGNAVFFPEILKIWAYWIPESLSPFLDPWRQPRIGRLWNPVILYKNRIHSFIEGLRIHFAAFLGLFIILLFWKRKNKREIGAEFKNVVFWTILFIVLVVEHAYASIGLNYCVYCFSVYMSFFSPLGVILLVLSFRYLSLNLERFRTGLVAFALIIFATLLGYGAFNEIGDKLALIEIPRMFTTLAGWRPDQYFLWGILENRFGIEYMASRTLLPTIAGFLTGLLAVLAGLFLGKKQGNTAEKMVRVFLIVGFVLSPTVILGNTYQNYDCKQDAVSGYENLGKELAAFIDTPQRVYWQGGNSIVPLLYVPDVSVYPAQINGIYTFYDFDDADKLTKFGLWNEELSDQWLQDADVVLIEESEYEGELRESIEKAGLVMIDRTSAPFNCRPQNEILVFQQP